MIVEVSDIFDCPVAEGTVMQVRASGVFPRTFILRNLTASTPSYKIQEDLAGTWTDLTLSDGTKQITLGAADSGTDVRVERITSANLLRVRMSGGTNDRDIELSLTRVYDDSNSIWGSPLL